MRDQKALLKFVEQMKIRESMTLYLAKKYRIPRERKERNKVKKCLDRTY